MNNSARKRSDHQQGFTLVEMAVTLVVMGLILSSFGIAASAVMDSRENAHQREELNRDGALALQRMVTAVRETPFLILPTADRPFSPQNETIREQRLPPLAGMEQQTAVLAVRLNGRIDRNADGVPDADNDADGRIDEDPGPDTNNDRAPGIHGIDDDGDLRVDENILKIGDDDEDDAENEDALDGGDGDKDGLIDEDPAADLNNDSAPGVAGLDDDGDKSIDEGSNRDDDEDGRNDEDWYDTVVFYLKDGDLIERQPAPYEVDGIAGIDGRDYIEAVIAENVSYFRVERIAKPGARALLVDISLELRSTAGQVALLNTRVRVGEIS